MAYIFDTNIFIRSKNEMPMDIWPTFWQRFKEMVNSGQIFTSVMVKDEIDKGKDELTEWVKNNTPKSFFLSLDADVMNHYTATQNWARSNPLYNQQALNTFANVADAYCSYRRSKTDDARNIRILQPFQQEARHDSRCL